MDIYNKYVLLTDTEHLRLVMHQAKRILGDRVKVRVANDEGRILVTGCASLLPRGFMEINCQRMEEAFIIRPLRNKASS